MPIPVASFYYRTKKEKLRWHRTLGDHMMACKDGFPLLHSYLKGYK